MLITTLLKILQYFFSLSQSKSQIPNLTYSKKLWVVWPPPSHPLIFCFSFLFFHTHSIPTTLALLQLFKHTRQVSASDPALTSLCFLWDAHVFHFLISLISLLKGHWSEHSGILIRTFHHWDALLTTGSIDIWVHLQEYSLTKRILSAKVIAVIRGSLRSSGLDNWGAQVFILLFYISKESLQL